MVYVLTPMRIAIVLIGLALTGCNTPEAFFKYDAKREIEVGENRFIVYHNRSAAQAVRLNTTALWKLKQVELDAIQAIEAVTGCEVRPNSFDGDPALIKVKLKCPSS